MCCSVLQCVAVCCSELLVRSVSLVQSYWWVCVVCCSVLQCVACALGVACEILSEGVRSVLQCVA